MKKIVYLLGNNQSNKTQIDQYLSQPLNDSLEIIQFKSFDECISYEQIPDIVIVSEYQDRDIIDGEKAMKIFKSMYSDVEFIFFTNEDSISNAINLIENGAFDYIINKPKNINLIDEKTLEKLKKSISSIISTTYNYFTPNPTLSFR